MRTTITLVALLGVIVLAVKAGAAPEVDTNNQSVRQRFVPSSKPSSPLESSEGAVWMALTPSFFNKSGRLALMAHARIGDKFPVAEKDGTTLFDVRLKDGDDDRLVLEILTAKDSQIVQVKRDSRAHVEIEGSKYEFSYPSVEIAASAGHTTTNKAMMIVSTDPRPHQESKEIPTIFTTASGLPYQTPDGEPLDIVRAIAVNRDGNVVASVTTQPGQNLYLIEFRDGAWNWLLPFIDHVTRTPQLNYVAAASGRVFGPGREPQSDSAAQEPYRYTAAAMIPGGGYLAGNGQGVSESSPRVAARQTIFAPKEPILALAVGPDGGVAVGVASALFLRAKAGAEFIVMLPVNKRYSWSPKNVRALAYDTKGRLWFGCDNGAGMWDGETWSLYSLMDGLPDKHFTCATPGENGAIWFGTEDGAIRFDGSHWAHRVGPEWLSDPHVNSIAVQPDGTTWIATNHGISRIAPTAKP